MLNAPKRLANTGQHIEGFWLSLVGSMHPLIFQGERDVMTRRDAYMPDFSRFGAPIYNLVKFAWGVINVAVTSRLVTELPFVGTGGGGGR
jgi:hypothetical protein